MTAAAMSVDEALLMADEISLTALGGKGALSALVLLAAEVRRQDAVIERCAMIARNGCLVPPDGGSPTEAERLLCEEIERRIRAEVA